MYVENNPQKYRDRSGNASWWSKAWNNLKKTVRNVWNGVKRVVNTFWNAIVPPAYRSPSSWSGVASGINYIGSYVARSYTPRRNYVGVNYIRGRNGQPVGYQTYNQALYYQSAAYRYQVQVQRAKATRMVANVRIKKVCDTADKKWTGTKKLSMGAGALLGLPTLIGGGSTLTATEAASALFTGAFGGLLIGTGYLIGKGINQRAKDLRTDDGIDARNYGVNRLPKGWSSNDYNVSGQRGSLVVDNLGRRRISIDRTNGKTTYYSANGETLDSNSDNVPDKVRDVLDHIKKNKGTPPDGYKGGREYKNNPQPGKQKLPDGKYKEYDVDPKVKGQDRNAERLVVDEEGNAWYTDDHYDTFKKVK